MFRPTRETIGLFLLMLIVFSIFTSCFFDSAEAKKKKKKKVVVEEITPEEQAKLDEEKEQRRQQRQLLRDAAWYYSDNAYDRCLNSGCHKLSCARLHQCVEDNFNDVGSTQATNLGRSTAEIVRFFMRGHNKWQWNMIVHQMVKWMKDNKVFDARLIREALDKQFSNLQLKLLVNDEPNNDNLFTDDMDPEFIERRLWRKGEKERKKREAIDKGEPVPVFPDDDDQIAWKEEKEEKEKQANQEAQETQEENEDESQGEDQNDHDDESHQEL